MCFESSIQGFIFKAIVRALALCLAVVGTIRAEIVMPTVFSDHMMLQAEVEIRVWGKTVPEAEIALTLAGQTRHTKAAPDGSWRVVFPSLAASTMPHTLVVTSGGSTLTVRDVLVGEVWLAAGQSNMAMSVAKSGERGNDLSDFASGSIRFFDGSSWKIMTASEMPKQSAVACAFSLAVAQARNVPVGMIVAAKGGTRIEAWMPRTALMKTAAGRNMATLATQPDVLEAAAEDAKTFAPYRQARLFKWRMGRALPMSLYDQLIAPLRDFSLRGVLWYQGESNANRVEDATAYAEHLPLLVKSWRTQFSQPSLPFLIVQLPRYDQPEADGGIAPWSQLRASQKQAVNALSNAVLVDAFDLGEAADIHPRRKAELGQRLAKDAMSHFYAP